MSSLQIVEQDKLIEKMCKTTQELRYYLTLAMLDHTGDYYYLPTIPLEVVLQKSNAGTENIFSLRYSQTPVPR